jgi:hypothetical protein
VNVDRVPRGCVSLNSHGRQVMLVTTTTVVLVGLCFQLYAPTVYAHTRMGFMHSPNLGKHSHVWSSATLFVGILLAAVVAIAIVVVRSRRRKIKKKSDGIPGWICSSCNEENPANISACWSCQHIRSSAAN